MAFTMPPVDGRRVDQPQLDGIQEGRIMIQRCIDCGTVAQPARMLCPQCHSTKREFFPSSGRGTLYSYVQPVHGVPEGAKPIVILVELEEGVRVMSGLKGIDIADVTPNMSVQAEFEEDEDGEKFLVFVPLDEEVTVARFDKLPVFHAPPPSRLKRPDQVRWEEASVSGIGQTEFSKDSGRPEIQLAAEACLAAIEDAGLTPGDIDGFCTFTQDSNSEMALMDHLGIPEINFQGRAIGGGMAACPSFQIAANAVISGAATNVLVYRAFNERSGRRFGQPMEGGGRMRPKAARFLNTPAGMYSLWYQRYMDTYGITNEDLGRYSVIAREYAATNPAAWFYERPITLDDHQSSRWIVEPTLRLLDCCQESDGGVAVVVSRTEQAKDSPHGAVKFASAAQGYARGNGGGGLGYMEADLAGFDDAKVAAQRAFRDAGLRPSDISVATIYENFSPVLFLTLEVAGFCGRGEAKDFVADGQIRIDGQLPTNPHGGLLGEAYIHGVNNVLECVRQVRGTAANQVADVDYAMALAGPGALIFSR